MVEKEINSYDYYVKNFPFIKFMLDKECLKHTNKILIVIFYDHSLYKKYLSIKKDCDFVKLIQDEFMEYEHYINEDDGVFIICGNLARSIDLVINNVFGEKRKLTTKELESIDVINGNKTNNNFYVSLLQIYFFESKADMSFKFNEIKNQYIPDKLEIV